MSRHPGMMPRATTPTPAPRVVHRPAWQLLLGGAGAGVLGLLPWLLTGVQLPLQNIWVDDVLPDQMPRALLPFSQYSITLLFGMFVWGAAVAGLLVRREPVESRTRAAFVSALGFLVVAGTTTAQTAMVVSDGLPAGDRRSELYFGGVLAVIIGSVVVGVAVLALLARAPRAAASVGTTMAALAAGSWLNALIVPPFVDAASDVQVAVLGYARWVPAVLVGAALIWCGTGGAGKAVAWLLDILLLWTVPSLQYVAVALVTALVGSGSAHSSRGAPAACCGDPLRVSCIGWSVPRPAGWVRRGGQIPHTGRLARVRGANMSVTRQLIIDGEHVPAAAGKTTDDIGPWTNETYAQVAAAAPEDVTRAVDSADAAFQTWAAMPPSERAAILHKAADLMEERTPQAIELMAHEVGGVAVWAGFNAHLAAGIFRSAASATTATQGQVLATDLPGKMSFGIRQPYGVVAAISPWNAPLILGTRAVAVPLAVGNTVVLKPSEDAPIACGLFIADCLLDAGLPPGVLNVVTSAREDGPEVVEALIADQRVRNVNFTGSTKVGRAIGTLAAQHIKPAVLELGGKNSLVVLESADVEYAVDAATFGAFMNAGQICMSVDRVVVDRRIADEFNQAFAKKVSELPSGDPARQETVVGPQVNQAAADRQHAQIEDAIQKGATVLAGGGRPEGRVVPPTVLADITPDMRIHAEEIFGAAATVYTVDGPDAAVQVANDTEYGLTAGVIAEDLRAGLAVAERIRTGIVHVNDQPVNDEPFAPFRGIQNSGYGKFGGDAGIESFTETRWLTVQKEGHAPYPF